MRELTDSELKAKLGQAMGLLQECIQALTNSPRILMPIAMAAQAYDIDLGKLYQYCRLGRMRSTCDGEGYKVAAEEMDRVFYPPVRTMLLETASKAYGVNLTRLRLYCTRGWVVAQKFNGTYYVTPQEMDRVFRGVVSKKPALPIPAEAPKWKESKRRRGAK
ncbi:hypothetical protein GMST_32740 [Geomonas silvestris]|uniref:Uncharacterized protein n=1 Tax=Geomonas silvestris TaxID=2740184 RepID=A0A6V8MMR7_9BACT|nr:hypothetical protein [Geomonas silvestris]GFO60949.1 hypothetical protein GMST_32740 [Geomonas silvestris]